MSVAEIIEELPKLTVTERMAVEAKLRELEERECLRVCEESATESARMLDAMEGDSGQRPTR